MKFDDAGLVDSLCYQMRMADYPRGTNRAHINDLFNGFPPYSDEEVEENKINVNVNFLEGTGIAHEARAQFTGAMQQPARFFSCQTDCGASHRRQERSAIVTSEAARVMKRSLYYFETLRSKFALDILHGIAPTLFRDKYRWAPQAIGIDDVMVPDGTLLTMEDLPFFAIYREFTAPELVRLTRGPNADPGWNQGQVDSILAWLDEQMSQLQGNSFPNVWSPEKVAERTKSDGGYYVGNEVPKLNAWDFYFYDADDKHAGWRRRLILDSWSAPEMQGGIPTSHRKQGKPFEKRDQWLYTSNNRVVAERREQIINIQFADLSAVAPFRYHSVRSLGFLLYSVCHLQNRLRCKFNEGVFQDLMMLFRVKNLDEAQRALKLELANQGFIDETLTPVPAAERHQSNWNLVQGGLRENQGIIARHSSTYTTTPVQFGSPDKREKTRFEVQAEIQQMTAMVSSALAQAYMYAKPEYCEIFTRLCLENSKDVDAQQFRARCARKGVPLKMLSPECWEIEPERVMGAGNKTLEMLIAEQLMSYRPLYDPSAQRVILRDVTTAITGDASRSRLLVPEQPEVSDSIHDAQLRWGSLMAGAPVNIKDGVNHTEVVETLLVLLGQKVKGMEQGGALPTPQELGGMINVAEHIKQEIAVVAQDKNEGPRVRQYGQALSEIENLLRAFMQRLQEQGQQQGAGQGMDPKDAAKIQAMLMQAKAKDDKTRDSHAQRTAQRQIQFEMEQRRKEREHQEEMRREQERAALETAETQLTSQVERRDESARRREEMMFDQAERILGTEPESTK